MDKASFTRHSSLLFVRVAQIALATPVPAMLLRPLRQCPLESDILALSLTEQPLMPVNFSQFSLEFGIGGRWGNWG
jgi:hypothetical protein